MLAIDVELLHGTIRAGSADDLAITGGGDPGEWPPSPARLFSALVAADGTGQRMRATTGVELRLLEEAPPPTIICDRELSGQEDPARARTGLLRSPQLDRYVVVDANVTGKRDRTDPSGRSQAVSVQEYPARKSEAVHRSAVLAPSDPRITFLWPDVEPTAAELDGLRARAARIGYFGCSDSPARVRVRTDHTVAVGDDRPAWEPDEESGTAFVETPYPGLVADLDGHFGAFTANQWVRRAWLPSHRTGYKRPGPTPVETANPYEAVVWLALDRIIAGRHILRLTGALREATMAKLQALRGPGARLPHQVSGHDTPDESWDQVLYLALPNVGHRHADGRIHGVAVAIPNNAPPGLAAEIRTAVGLIAELRLTGGGVVAVSASAGRAGSQAADPTRWTRPSRRFVSAFPVVHDHFTRRGPTLDDVGRWCHQVHLPPPISARLNRLPLLPGAIDLRPHEAARAGRPKMPYGHLELQFAVPVRGPLALGHLRSFGLGLVAPVGGGEGGQPDG